MIFLELVGVLVAIVVFLLLLTQVILPLLFSTPFFPLLRKETPLRHAVDVAEHELEEKTELHLLQKRLFDLNQEQVALEKQITETVVDPKP